MSVDYGAWSPDKTKLTKDYYERLIPEEFRSETAESSDKAEGILAFIPRRTIEELSGDWWENGELFCGKCHSPKSMDGGQVAVSCKCFGLEEERNKKSEELRKRKERCFQNSRLMDCTFDKLDEDSENRLAIETAKAFCDDWECMRKEGGGIVFCGSTGTGKTSIAAAMANELMTRGVSARMVRASDILVKADDKGDFASYVDDLCKPSLLILDDYGSSRATEFAFEKLLNFVDHRRDTGKPLIVTTNLSAADLNSGNRIHSRIVDKNSVVPVVGRDRRKENGFSTQKRLEKLVIARLGKKRDC